MVMWAVCGVSSMASLSLSFSSSIVPSPIHSAKPNPNPNPITQGPNIRVARCSISAPASKTAFVSSSSRHWKEGEFLGISETTFSGNTRKTSVKKNKKVEKKNNHKAWAHTLPEALSYCIHKKHWLKALQVTLFSLHSSLCFKKSPLFIFLCEIDGSGLLFGCVDFMGRSLFLRCCFVLWIEPWNWNSPPNSNYFVWCVY